MVESGTPADPTIPEYFDLDGEQRARAEALVVARRALKGRALMGGERVLTTVDLVTLAQWILDGVDPRPAVRGQVSAAEQRRTTNVIR